MASLTPVSLCKVFCFVIFFGYFGALDATVPVEKTTCPLPDAEATIECEQLVASEHAMTVAKAKKITCMSLVAEQSHHKCIGHYSKAARWYFNDNSIWAYRKCKATFNVCYEPVEDSQTADDCPEEDGVVCEVVGVGENQEKTLPNAETITCMKEKSHNADCWNGSQALYEFHGDTISTPVNCGGTFHVCYEPYSRDEPACAASQGEECEEVTINGPTSVRIDAAQHISCVSMVEEYSNGGSGCWLKGDRKYSHEGYMVMADSGCHLKMKVCYTPYENTPSSCPTPAASQTCEFVTLSSDEEKTMEDAASISCVAEKQQQDKCWQYGEQLYSFTQHTVRTHQGCNGIFQVCYQEWPQEPGHCPDEGVERQHCIEVELERNEQLKIREATRITCMKEAEIKDECWHQGNPLYEFDRTNKKVKVTNGCSGLFKVCYTL